MVVIYGKSKGKNIGWRIDYFIVSKSIENKIEDSIIYSEVMGSDHCPVGLKIKIWKDKNMEGKSVH